MTNRMRWILFTLTLVSAVLIGGGTGFAQNTNSGDVRGTATDSTGAVIPDVTVTVTDVDRGVVRTYQTDGAGLYDTGAIPEDHYKFAFTKGGFETFVRGPVTISLGIQTVDAVMQVGQVSQQVTVTTDIPMLNTETGSLEPTLEAETMDELPQVGSGNGGGADWENFIQLIPGAVGTPENQNGEAPGQGNNVGTTASINGNEPYQSYLQDGATTTLPMSQNSDVTIFETTAEVKVSATAFSAQYGLGDIIYNQITKSGTDQFHGAAYDYNQNNYFNAASYGFGSGSIPHLRFNNFGGAVGGPVLPKSVFRHSFFYFDYDHTINNGTGNVQTVTLPSTAELGGNFTQAGLPTLYDPRTQTVDTTSTGCSVAAPCVTRQTFASEYGTNAIPANLVDPAAKAIIAFVQKTTGYPATVNSYAPNNFQILGPAGQAPFIKWFGRWDSDLSSNNRLTLTETESDNPGLAPAIFFPLQGQTQDVSRNNAAISDVWTVSPHVINEARMGFTNQFNFFAPLSTSNGYSSALGIPSLQDPVFPNINVSNYWSGKVGSATHAVYKEMVFDPSDVVTIIHGRHVLHFGGEFLINRADSTNWGNENPGSFSYTGNYTSQSGSSTAKNSGDGFADFLLGDVSSWGANNTPEWSGRWKSPQMFVQDDIKLRPNLTVNLGVRWEIETGWRDAKGNQSTFDPAVQNFNLTSTGAPGAAIGTPGTPGYIAPGAPVQGGIWYAFEAQNGRTSLQKPKYNIVLPRVGFSYQIRPETVIRGGIGMFGSTWSEDTYGGGEGGAFGSSGGYGDNTKGICPVLETSSALSTVDTTDAGCGTASYNVNPAESTTYLTAPTTVYARNGSGPSSNEYNTPVPYNFQYDLTVEQQFLKDWTGSVSYVGNKGINMIFPNDINQVPVSELSANDRAFMPYQLFQGIAGNTNNATSNYNALDAVVTKRMSYGLTFSANYGWSHFLDESDGSGWANRDGNLGVQNSYVPKQNYGPSNFDVRQAFRGYAVYQLPFGRGKQFLNNNLIADEVLGGWEASSTFIAESGNPVLIVVDGHSSNNNANSEPRGVVGGLTDSGNQVLYPNLTGNYKDVGGIAHWYDLNAFSVPAPYTFGTFSRNGLRGPDITNVNLALGKSFDVWPEHGVKFQIRASAANLLNHPSFGQPGRNVGYSADSSAITSTTINGRDMEFYGRLSF
jgi:Carboxypeptidase regulatory-like domain